MSQILTTSNTFHHLGMFCCWNGYMVDMVVAIHNRSLHILHANMRNIGRSFRRMDLYYIRHSANNPRWADERKVTYVLFMFKFKGGFLWNYHHHIVVQNSQKSGRKYWTIHLFARTAHSLAPLFALLTLRCAYSLTPKPVGKWIIRSWEIRLF